MIDELKNYLEKIQANHLFEEDRRVIVSPMMFYLSIEEIEKYLKENGYKYEIEESDKFGKYAVVYLLEEGEKQ